MPTITIQLNGEKREIVAGSDLVDLLEHFSLPAQRVAVELNGAVIRRTEWAGTTLGDGDKIEVVHFVGGG
ncbi:MAG: sulfur carrier protein ThiS [Pyrinomonadaceae bacterium]